MITRFVAPAGAPIRAADLLRLARALPSPAAAEVRLKAAVTGRTGRRHCALLSTGRAGLAVALSALSSLAGEDRDEVIVPSYTCYSVAASVVRAGLRLRIIDIDPASLDFDLEQLGNADYRRVLAIIAPSLYGLPARLNQIERIACDHRVFLIDDAAQALGATLDDRPVGGWGDAGLISFDKGKNVAAIDGGAIVSSAEPIVEAIAARIATLRRPGFSTEVAHVAKIAVYALFLRPEMYWLPNSLSILGLGKTVYRCDFAIDRSSALLTTLAATMVGRLDEFQSARVAIAGRYSEGLRGSPRLHPIVPVEGATPAYLRFPLLVDDPVVRDRILQACQQAGLGGSASYPGSIADIPDIQGQLAGRPEARNGRLVACRILTLPTHPYVSGSDVDRAVDVVLTSSDQLASHLTLKAVSR